MASFTVYDPKTKVFRALETADTVDLPFEQVLLVNILIELRVISTYLSSEQDKSQDDVDDIRASLIEEVN